MSHGPLTTTIDGDVPPRKRIYVEHRDGRPAIFLPRALVRGRMWILFAIGLPVLVFPMLIEVGSGKFMAHLVFQTIGILIVGFGVFMALIRQVVVDDGEQLVIELNLFGHTVHYNDVLKRDIETVTIRPVHDTSKKAQDSPVEAKRESKYSSVYLDASGDREFSIAACLSIEELEWVRRKIEFWVRRGSDL